MKDVSILSSNNIDFKKGIELLGDIETYDDMLVEFLGEVDEKLNNIKNFKETSDMSNYAILVHSLKSDSKYFGFDKLADLAFQHEMESKSNNVVFVNENFDALMNEANRIVDVVKRYVNSQKEGIF